MKSRRRLLLAACTLSACLVWARPASAFWYAGQAWCCDTVYYHVNATNPTHACGYFVVGPWFHYLVDTAARIWNAQGTQFQLVCLGTTTTGCVATTNPNVCMGQHDGLNTISMSQGCNWLDDGVIAFSTWWYYTVGDSSGCIYESDICFNNDITWYDNVDYDIWHCSGSCYDVLSLALHEMGHWIAANHENDNGTFGYKPVMYYSYDFCELRRLLTSDDVHALSWAYDGNGTIALPARTVGQHLHPADAAYNNPPPHDSCLCDCPCHGDPQCDGVPNVQDVVQTVNVAFRGGAPVFDPHCPYQRTDVNCDAVTTVIDVVKVVNVAFRNAKPATEYCDPCP